jgi:hypothetical protein
MAAHSVIPSSCHSFIAILFSLLAGSMIRADLHVPQPEVDAGEVRAGAPLGHRFTFVNRGPQTIEITEVQSSCGCLTPKLEQRRLQPGEEGALLMEVNTLSQAVGRHAWQVKLTYRMDKNSYKIPLRIKANLIREIVVEPAAVTVFADSTVGSEIRVTDLRPQPLAITEVRTSCPGLEARPAGESRDSTGHLVRKIRLQVADNLPDGRHDEALSIFTDDPAYREIKVPVTIVKHARQGLSAMPSRVDLLAPPGQPVPSRIVLVRDNHDHEVLRDAVTSDNPAILCQWAKGPGNMATLKITADQKGVPEEGLQGSVQVNVSKPVKQTLTIPVQVTLQ